MKKVTPITLFILCFTFFNTIAQVEELSFERYSTDQGLSQSFVNTLTKDSAGFVWIGTQNGLNRFDGLNFLTYYSDKSKAGALSNNYIWDICQGQKDKLWIGTKGAGLCLYQAHLNKFTSFPIDSLSNETTGQNSVRAIFKLKNSALLIATEEGLFSFDTINFKFKKLKNNQSGETLNLPVYSFHRVSDSEVLIGCLEQIFIYNEETEKLYPVKNSTTIQGGIHAFAAYEKSDLWVGSGNGLFQFKWIQDQDSLDLIQHFQPDASRPDAITSSYISSLLFDEKNGLWIGTNDGLNFLNTQQIEEGFSHFKTDIENQFSISNNLIYDILEVEPGVYWVATQDGVNQFSLNNSDFKKYKFNKEETGDCGTSAHGMIEDAQGTLLVCTEKGLTIIGNNYSTLECLNKNSFPNMEDEFLVSISPGENDQFWIALRRGGFAKFKSGKNENTWEAFKLPAGKYSQIGTNDLLADKNSNLWIASSGLGLWKWDQITDTYYSFTNSKGDSLSISGNYIFHLFEDHAERLWVSTADGGLCIMNRDAETFKCFKYDATNENSISSNMVLSVFEDSKNRIWACTADGLNLYSEEGSFRRFYKKDGLPNNLIYGMQEDSLGYLWLSTDQGLSKIKLDHENLTVKNYNKENGLLNNEFNQHAFLKLKSGELVFGSKNGINYFKPSTLKGYEVIPKLVFTDFKIFNKSVSVNMEADQKEFVLEQSINATSEIILPYNKNFIAFEYIGINFEEASSNQYAYLLEGLDEDWIYCGDRKFANYPGLKPGTYTFKVKVANHDGLWTDAERAIKLVVKNPPWKTWWAYLIYALSGFLLVYGIFKYRIYGIRKIEQTKQEERIKFRKKSAQDFHDEAGNQITKISLISEIAKRKSGDNEELKGLLDEVGTNIQNLRSGMRDFIWVLDPDNDNLFETLLRLQDFANGIFEYAPIHYRTIGIEEELKTIILPGNVRRHLLLIFKEVINNCLKYSKAQNAQLEIYQRKGIIILKFWDDGIGFDWDTSNGGNGLRNIKTRAQKIGADVETGSVKNKETYIQLSLDITQMGD